VSDHNTHFALGVNGKREEARFVDDRFGIKVVDIFLGACLRLSIIIASESSDGCTAQRHFFTFFPDTVRGKWEERRGAIIASESSDRHRVFYHLGEKKNEKDKLI